MLTCRILSQNTYKIILMDGENAKKVRGVFSFRSEEVRNEILQYIETRFDRC